MRIWSELTARENYLSVATLHQKLKILVLKFKEVYVIINIDYIGESALTRPR